MGPFTDPFWFPQKVASQWGVASIEVNGAVAAKSKRYDTAPAQEIFAPR